jgi:hypothetical protein
MIRNWVTKLSKSVNSRAVARRRQLSLPIKISFEPDRNTGSLRMPIRDLSISGETKDLSLTGVAFIVSSIRVNEAYLVGEGRLLNAEITFPSGKVKLQLRGERYEQIGDQHLSISEYIVGAKIIYISEEDKDRYVEFLKGKKQKNTGPLELGIDKGNA